MLFEQPGCHSRVTICFRLAGKSLLLAFTRTGGTLTNRAGRFLGPLACHVAIFDRRYFDVQIDPIEQRAGNAPAITLHLHRSAAAFAFQIAKISARAGIHRRHQHEFARKRQAAGRA